MYLKETDLEIEIIEDNTDEVFYSIQKAYLDETIEENGRKISNWINQLLIKTEIEKNILYEVAQIIVREFPKNKINWQATFFMVEKYIHDNDLKTKYDLENPTLEKSITESLYKSIEIGRQTANEVTSKEISDKVDTLLEKYEIIKVKQ